jgi:hypothetical protein
VPVMTPPPGALAPAATEPPSQAPQTLEPHAGQQTSAQPQQPAASRRPQEGVTISPATRAPISVAPQPRPAFPNQDGQRGGPNQGDLVPGIGLPGPL